MFKFDCHTHSVEGSYDAQVGIVLTINTLKKKGYSGLVTTDHDTFDGWNYYLKNKRSITRDFVVIKGIEVWTAQGHLLVIPNSKSKYDYTNKRDIDAEVIVDAANREGDLVGAAHPYCEEYGIMRSMNRDPYKIEKILSKLDFIEVFNPDLENEFNKKAVDLSNQLGIPGTGGSDSHTIDRIGLGYTGFINLPKNNDEFIEMVRLNYISKVTPYGKR